MKLWDLRLPNSSCNILTVSHSFPIETLLPIKGGGIVIVAGGGELQIVDILGGGRIIHKTNSHQKTITCLAINKEGTRLLSGGLDHYVKVYDIQDYHVVHTMTYPSPILSLGISVY